MIKRREEHECRHEVEDKPRIEILTDDEIRAGEKKRVHRPLGTVIERRKAAVEDFFRLGNEFGIEVGLHAEEADAVISEGKDCHHGEVGEGKHPGFPRFDFAVCFPDARKKAASRTTGLSLCAVGGFFMFFCHVFPSNGAVKVPSLK